MTKDGMRKILWEDLEYISSDIHYYKEQGLYSLAKDNVNRAIGIIWFAESIGIVTFKEWEELADKITLILREDD